MILFLATLLSSVLGQQSDVVSFGKPALMTRGMGGRGLNALLPNWNWRTRNVTELYVGSIDGQNLLRFDLASCRWTLLAHVEGGVSALAFSSLEANQRSLGAGNDVELYYASPASGRVFALKLDKSGARVTREVAAPRPVVGVRSLAFTRKNQQLHAVAALGVADELYYYENSKIRKQWQLAGDAYGQLGQVAFAGDNTLFGVSMRERSVVRLYSGHATHFAQLPRDVLPVGVAFDSKFRLYVGANRVTANERQAEIYRVDMQTRNVTLVAAIGGALLDSFVFSYDDRLFLSDAAHGALHEVEFAPFLADESRLIADHRLASGGANAGAAGAPSFRGNANWRTRMLFGGESLVSGAGVAAFNTNDGTEIALVADSFQIKSLTARKFLDSWPMPATNADNRPLRITNVHVEPARRAAAGAAVLPRNVYATDFRNGDVFELSPFAPHVGDLTLRQRWSGFASPYGVARVATGSVLVATFANGEVKQTDGFVVARDLEGPCGVALGDSNGKLVYVTEWIGGRLVALDVDARTRRVLLDGLNHPEGVAVNPLNGHVVVLESGGAGRLLSLDPAVGAASVVEIATNLTRGYRDGDTTPGVFSGVAFGDVVGAAVAGESRSVALYVALDGSAELWRVVVSQQFDDPNAKPLVPGVVQTPTRERDGRQVVVVNLFHADMPAHIAVPVGTWLRFIARRGAAPTQNGKYDAAGARWLTSDDIDGFKAQFLYPAISGDVENYRHITPMGASSYEIHLNKVGIFSYRDALRGAPGKVTVYAAEYDDRASDKYRPNATPLPTPEPTKPKACRTKAQVDCPPGAKVDGVTDADGCLTGEIRCIPVGYSLLVYKSMLADGSPGNVHGGYPPYVPRSWRVTMPIEAPGGFGSAYPWAVWRDWFASVVDVRADPSQYWYAPQHRRVANPDDLPYNGGHKK